MYRLKVSTSSVCDLNHILECLKPLVTVLLKLCVHFEVIPAARARECELEANFGIPSTVVGT